MFPENVRGKPELSRVELRLTEQRTGNYDFGKINKAVSLSQPLIDCATFKGSIDIRDSEGRGQGTFTTKAVKAENLLLCEKAFSYCFEEPAE